MKNALLLQDKLFIEYYKKAKEHTKKEKHWKREKEAFMGTQQELRRELKLKTDFQEKNKKSNCA